MAKKSMVAREKKRAGLVKKYAAKRAELKAIISSPNSADEEVWEAKAPKAAAQCKPGPYSAPMPYNWSATCGLP